MIVDTKIQYLIPLEIKQQEVSSLGDIKHWLRLQHLEPHRVYYCPHGYKITFANPKHDMLFRLQYAEYIL